MAFEKRLKAVPLQLFTANGTNLGKVTIPDACAFKVKQQVILSSSTQGQLRLEVKRVEDDFVLYVGPISDHQHKSSILDRTDISAFLTADTASIKAEEQKRPNIPEQEIERLTYEEEPTVARRSILVDACGDKISEDNPLPIKGDITVIIPPGGGGTPINEFSSISSLIAGPLTDIITYTVPPANTGILYRVEFGGTNVATYELHINGIIEARYRSWHNGTLTSVFEFSSGASGFPLAAGDIIKVKVYHGRPFTGDFEARVQLQLFP